MKFRLRIHHLLVVVFCVLLIFAFMTVAQTAPEIARYQWSARWITSPDSRQRDPVVLHFRKSLDLAQKPEHFVVQVSADNQFIFYVNQQWIGAGPAKSDLGHWRYETYDIGPMLLAGHNVLTAMVWNFGVLTPLAQISDRTGFVLHGVTEAERMADTGDAWEVEEEKGISLLPSPLAVVRKYYVSEPAEQINGSLFNWNWNSGGGGNWKKAKALGEASLLGGSMQNDNWQLVPDPLPAMEMTLAPAGRVLRATGIDPPTSFPDKGFSVPAHSKVEVLIDHSHLTTAYPELTVSGGRDSTVRLTYAEALFDDQGIKGNRDKITGKHIKEFSTSSCRMVELLVSSLRSDGGRGVTYNSIFKLEISRCKWTSFAPGLRRIPLNSADGLSLTMVQ